MQPRGNSTLNQACDGGTVRRENGAEKRITGVGSMQMCMFDGVVRTLTGVRHVLELRKNLNSLGTLDSSGYRCLI